jgi:maltooligosyltrehalose trehalohydrolase
MSRQYHRPGLSFAAGNAEVSLWAPAAQRVALALPDKGRELPMALHDRGWWRVRTGELHPGDRYQFVLDDDKTLPDPASLKQPAGVHGASEAVDLGMLPADETGWKGIALRDYIIYEIHTGTFSATGDFDGILRQLGFLQDLGITAIELMPVAAFPGSRNWGYDGVCPFAVHTGYGGPEGLAKLVGAAHRHGIAVILDCVYNHLGPEGNYFGAFGPYFTDKYKTPWGSAVNFDDAGCDAVREYFIANALMWLRDFGVDALRLDAVHAIKDFSVKHILQELREAVDELESQTGRRYHLIVENDLNDPRFIRNRASGGFAMDGQWVDEFHHALRVSGGQERTGYYSDFNGIEHLAKSYRDAYVYDGQYSPHRDRHFGAPAREAAAEQFVVFSQNHDQIGNRMLGERSSTLISLELQKVFAAAVLLSPFIPLLFMGEEWSEPAPFQYFISHSDPQLIEAVRNGRAAEFKDFQTNGTAPDPQDEQTFLQCRLNWHLPALEPHATMLRYYKKLIRLRKTHPALQGGREGVQAEADPSTGVLRLQRRAAGSNLYCVLNFSQSPATVPAPPGASLLLNSAAAIWGGEAPAGNTADTSHFIVQPESCLIYDIHV